LTGTIFGLLYAYGVRFLSLAYGTIDDGFDRIPRNLDLAARSLGASRRSVLTRLHSQLMRAPLIAALLLVFVDAMKELPATLILRPFNFETLSTQVYTQASLGQFEQAALPALTIVAVGLIPIFIMLQLFDRLRQKSRA
jgi:iron(III) transport system permease protein